MCVYMHASLRMRVSIYFDFDARSGLISTFRTHFRTVSNGSKSHSGGFSIENLFMAMFRDQ